VPTTIRNAEPPKAEIEVEGGDYAVDTETGEVWLYGAIGLGLGVAPVQLARDLRAIQADRITLYINSPGGWVDDGTAIYNLLRRETRPVDIIVDGLAASIASVIAMAGDTVTIADGAFLMIHRAWALVLGNANDLDDAARLLRKFDDAIVDIYARRTGQDAKAINKWMDAETWFTAQEAVDAGFADRVGTTAQGDAEAFDLSLYTNVPADLGGNQPGPAGETDDQFRRRAAAFFGAPNLTRPRAFQSPLTKGDTMATTDKPKAQDAEPQADEQTPETQEPETEPTQTPAEPEQTDTDADSQAVQPDADQPETPEETEADGDAEPTPDSEAQARKAEGQKFIEAFGETLGAKYFALGLTFDQARDRYTADLEQRVSDLEAAKAEAEQRLASIDRGEDEPAEVVVHDDTPEAKRLRDLRQRLGQGAGQYAASLTLPN